MRRLSRHLSGYFSFVRIAPPVSGTTALYSHPSLTDLPCEAVQSLAQRALDYSVA